MGRKKILPREENGEQRVEAMIAKNRRGNFCSRKIAGTVVAIQQVLERVSIEGMLK